MATLVAHCRECGDTHPLGDRNGVVGTTACPVCESTSYNSECTGETITESTAERIHSTIEDADGVGSATASRIVSNFSTFAGLENAGVEDLTQIKNVGETTAQNIVEETA